MNIIEQIDSVGLYEYDGLYKCLHKKQLLNGTILLKHLLGNERSIFAYTYHLESIKLVTKARSNLYFGEVC